MQARVERPRLARSVLLQALALALGALASERPWAHREVRPEPPPSPKKQERRIRVVKLTPPPRQPKDSPAPPKEAASQPKESPSPPKEAPAAAAPRPPAQVARSSPAPRGATPPLKTPAQKPSMWPLARIAADSTAVHGVRLRVLVPRGPRDLAAHLQNSGGCLVVSRLSGEGAEVVSTLLLDGARAVELSSPPCGGVPRLLRDASLNDAIGDPLGRARTAMPGEDLVLQVLLTPRLHAEAQAALRAHFGPVSEEEMSRRAAEAGYELTCFAEPSGQIRCQ
jgi:hypothetical protein